MDLAGYTVTIQIADGTYTAGLSIASPWTGGGRVTVQGNGSTPANVVINCASSSCMIVTAVLPGILHIKDMKLVSSGGGSTGIEHAGAGTLNFSNIDFGACGSWHMSCSRSGAFVDAVGDYAISGGAAGHVLAMMFGVVRLNGATVTLTGTPAFGVAFVYLSRAGLLSAEVMTFVGSATGARYSVDSGSIIYTGGGGATYFPGNASGAGGTTSGGGFYN